jgi:hypothetical protein
MPFTIGILELTGREDIFLREIAIHWITPMI